MSFTQLSFYVFGAVLVFAAAMVITIRNPVKAALFLVLAFFSAACVWMTLEAEFLAIVLVLVYVGVLFLFVVMMLDINLDRLREGFTRYLPIGGLVAAIMVAEMIVVLTKPTFGLAEAPRPVPRGADYSNTRELGQVIYTDYVYPFEIAAIILLVAIIAAIALTLRRRPDTRYQQPHRQVAVKAADRLRIIPIGIFLNRKNVVILLMAIELMLLAVNMNFVAFSHYLQDTAGQVFVFFILTVAAAEAAIGLAILIVLFRNRRSINVEDLDMLKG